MYIYKNSQNVLYPILDDKLVSHTLTKQDCYHFFNNALHPDTFQAISCLYLQYQIIPFQFEKYPQIYTQTISYIQNIIIQYFDYNYANLMRETDCSFLLVFFDASTEKLYESVTQFNEYLSKKKFVFKHKKCEFEIHCGIYVSHFKTSVEQLCSGAIEQCYQAINHGSLCSILSSC